MTTDAYIHRTRFWEPLDDGRVRCTVCPRFCTLREGQRGFCFVRANRSGEVVLTSYGLSSGYCVDPIETKPLNHFLPGTPILSFGTAGCNLGCRFCQNWDMSKSREMARLSDRASPEKIARAARELGCRSVAFTYNDPIIFLEYAVDVAKACHELDIRTVAVTAGYINPGAREAFFEHMDAANVDLKAFTDAFYAKICGGGLEAVKDTLVYLRHETPTWFELTTLLIPGENDGDDELRAMADWVVARLGPDVPWHFTAFHPDFKMRDKPRTPPETLLRARDTARACGVRHAYVGNVHHEAGDSTYCHACGTRLIGRDWYVMTCWNLTEDGTCPGCGERPAGVFESRPGDWGARRLPVNLRAMRQ